MSNDWRLTNQMNYLFRKKILKTTYEAYRKDWQHDHCEFCSERIDETTKEVYTTEDKYHWICPKCFHDFKKIFEWQTDL